MAESTSWVAHDEHKIIFLHPIGIYLEVIGGFERYIVFAKSRPTAIWRYIGPYKGKVAIVPRPHPVIAFASKLANVARRHIHHADVLDGLVVKKHIRPAHKHLRNLVCLLGILGLGCLFDVAHGRTDARQTRCRIGNACYGCQHLRRHIVVARGNAHG